MNVRTGSTDRNTGRAFTLLELLLSVALLLLLLSAVVFNFSGLQRGAPLDEGANQIDALIRYARAQASSSGRQVRLAFEESPNNNLLAAKGQPRLLWETDPVSRPGLFEPLAEADEYVRGLNDLIRIEGVRLVEGDDFEPESPDTTTALKEGAEVDPILATFPELAFFPDGSSDSAEILLSSRSEDDSRRVAVRLLGMTGSIRRKLIAEELKPVDSESRSQPEAAGKPADTPPLR